MIRTIAFYGIAGALVVGSLMTAGMMEFSGQGHAGETGIVVGYLTQLVALLAVFMGIKSYRDNALGGVIKFLPALGIGLAISAVASLGWVIAWDVMLWVTKMDFSAVMIKTTVEQAQAKGITGAELEKIRADAEGFWKLYEIPPIRWAESFVEMFPTGVLVSVVSAGLLRFPAFMRIQRRPA